MFSHPESSCCFNSGNSWGANGISLFTCCQIKAHHSMDSTKMMHQIGALDAAPTERPHQKHAKPELSKVLGKCIMEKNIWHPNTFLTNLP